MLSAVIPNRNEENIYKVMDGLERYADQIIVFRDRYGRGKGYALRQALKCADGDIIIIIDGDHDIDPIWISKLLPCIPEYDVVVAKKNLPANKKRRLITLLSRLYIRVVFGIKVDTQTGLKIFNYKPSFKTDGWAFDIEMIYEAKRLGKKIKQVPIEAQASGTKSWRIVCRCLLESVRIRLRL